MSAVTPFDPFSREFRDAPYAAYRKYREHDPVHWGAPPTPGFRGGWYLTRHVDVNAMLRDARFGRELRRIVPAEALPALPEPVRPFVDAIMRCMMFRDPPDHTRLRSLVNKAFSAAAVDRMRERIGAIADELLGAVDGKGRMDVIHDYALPLSFNVVAEMLGVPTTERAQMREWSTAMAAALDVRQSIEASVRASQATLPLVAYLGKLIEAKRSEPGDDILGRLIVVEEEGVRLSAEELVSMCILLIIAGHETTVGLIGNGLLTLLQHPAQLAALRADTALDASAVEEMLRYEPSFQMVFRIAMEDAEIGGKAIRKGDSVCAVLGAANRDPEVFDDPDAFDIGRRNNRHLAFAAGVHYCLGAGLARLEGQIAIRRILDRLPSLRLAAAPQWRDLIAGRSLERFEVAF